MFVDIHNHILPGIDDGARGLSEALDMAMRAAEGGTDILVATPHRAWADRRDAPPDWVRPQVARLQAALGDAGIPLTVLPGVEAQIGPRLAAELQDGRIGTLGGGNWVLIEPPFERIPPDALDHLKAVLDAGFRVVLAHPERSADIQQSLDFVRACADLGIAFQLTTGSLLGRFGPRALGTGHAILAHAAEWPLVIASDTHDLTERSPALMSAARDAAAQMVGTDEADRMVNERPRSFVTGTRL